MNPQESFSLLSTITHIKGLKLDDDFNRILIIPRTLSYDCYLFNQILNDLIKDKNLQIKQNHGVYTCSFWITKK